MHDILSKLKMLTSNIILCLEYDILQCENQLFIYLLRKCTKKSYFANGVTKTSFVLTEHIYHPFTFHYSNDAHTCIGGYAYKTST